MGRGLFLARSAGPAVAAKESVVVEQPHGVAALVEHGAEVFVRHPKRESVGNYAGNPSRSLVSCHLEVNGTSFMAPLSNSFLNATEPRKLYAVPRKQPIQGREADICRRLRQYREKTKLSRVAVASKLGISTEALRRVEDARVLLSYDLAWRIGNLLRTRPRWLFLTWIQKKWCLIMMKKC